jgi:hypothetical protein
MGETDQLIPVRESPSRQEAVMLSLAAAFLLNCVAGVWWRLLADGRGSQDTVGHTVFGVYLAVVTLCVGWRAVRAWRRRRSSGSRSSQLTTFSHGV